MRTQGDGIVKARIYAQCVNVRRNRGRTAFMPSRTSCVENRFPAKQKTKLPLGFLAGGTRFVGTQGDGIVKARIYAQCVNVRRNHGRTAFIAVADMLRGESPSL